MIIALWAGLAMFAEDILGVLMTLATAKNRGWLAGILDALGWYAAILTTTVSVSALQGHSLSMKIAVFGAVTAANITGSWSGVEIGRRLIKDPEKAKLIRTPSARFLKPQ